MSVAKVSLQQAMNKLKKTYGSASVFKGSENISIEVETTSSGCLAVDHVLRVGGLPHGRIIEISGNEGSGKTIFCASTIAAWQKQGKVCAFIDAEHAADKGWFENIGVQWDDLIFARPDTLEEALDHIHTLASTGEVDLIIWDSVPALPSMSEEKTAAGHVQVASIAKVLTPALRRLTPIFAKNKCTGIFINQIREKIGVMFGSPETTPGGRALKFGASLRLQMGKMGGSDIVDPITKKRIGHRIKVRSLKNKLSNAQGVTAEFTLYYDTGIDIIGDTIEMALLFGNDIVQRPNTKTWIYKDLEVKGKLWDKENGNKPVEYPSIKANFLAQLQVNEELLSSLLEETRVRLLESDASITDAPLEDDELEDDND